MLTFLGLMTALGGLFLFLWYRTIVSLPVKKQPMFIHPAFFKWGIPASGAAMFAAGLYMLLPAGPRLLAGVLAAAVLLTVLILKFDRYSAEMRIIRDQYRTIRAGNPAMDESEVLFLTARRRYPEWTHDRIVELVAGKDIESLVLLMLINEHQINPLSDWELYRSLKAKAARVVGAGS
jgi:hypothetical protein